MNWAQLRRTQLDAFDRSTPVILPVAAVEQHGEHLPLDTDVTIVEAVATRLSRSFGDRLLILPTQKIGCSQHHMEFPGSLTLSHETFEAAVIQTVESAFHHGFRRLFVLNGHGGNQAINGVICERLGQRHPETETVVANWWTPAQPRLAELQEGPLGSVGHACEFETSIMLVLAADRVDMTSARDDGRLHRALPLQFDLLHGPAALSYRPFHELSESGVYGMPSLASRDKGERVLAAVNDALVALLTELWPDIGEVRSRHA